MGAGRGGRGVGGRGAGGGRPEEGGHHIHGYMRGCLSEYVILASYLTD